RLQAAPRASAAGRRSPTGCTRPRARTGTASVPSGRSRCAWLGPPLVGQSLSLLEAPSDLTVPEAAHHVVVHHAHGLHEGVADRRAHEPEAPALEILAHRS